MLDFPPAIIPSSLTILNSIQSQSDYDKRIGGLCRFSSSSNIGVSSSSLASASAESTCKISPERENYSATVTWWGGGLERGDWKSGDALICDWCPGEGSAENERGVSIARPEPLCFSSNISHINNSVRKQTDPALCIHLRFNSTRASYRSRLVIRLRSETRRRGGLS